MKSRNVLTLIVWFVGVLGVEARAADSVAVGAIEGRVLNAASASYVEHARITVEGTALETFSDADGHFLLTGIPSGDARVRVAYTGAMPSVTTVRVTPGQTTTQDVSLALIGRRAATEGEAVKLDRFVVGESREMSGAAIAINEQRFARNIRNVVSTDEFGAVTEGNVGEFLKYMPGVSVDQVGGDARTISIDGAPAANTPITLSGLSLPSPGNNNTNRAVEVGFFNLNNVSRIEVSYSPTPDSPGSALAGSVNMVPRSAFERVRPEFSGSVYVMMRDDARDFGKTPSLYRDPRSTVHPGMDFSWTVPVNKRFGFSVSAGSSTQWSNQVGHTNTWRGVGTATGGNFPATTPGNPYLTNYSLLDGPKETERHSLGLTLDLKLTSFDRVALSYQYSAFDGRTGARTLGFATGGIVPGSFSPANAQGTAGLGTLTNTTGNGRVRANRTQMPTLTWRHDGPAWKLDAGVGRAYGTNAYRDADQGMLNSMTATRTGVTIGFRDVTDTRPGTITVTDNATGATVNPFLLSNYILRTVATNPNFGSDLAVTANANAERSFLLRVPFTIKTGVDFRQSARDLTGSNYSYTYNGGGSNPVGSATKLLDPYTSQRLAPYGWGPIQWMDYKGGYDYLKANPTQFVLDENNLYRTTVSSSKFISEAVSSAYVRGDLALLDRRLLIVGGVRAEQTNIRGEGPLTDLTRNIRRDTNGRPILDAAGRTIPIATAALDVSRLTFLERAAKVEKEYLRFFPSLNASYNVRENLIFRAAVSTSIGRPNLNQYASGVTLPDTDITPSRTNLITTSNAAIKPWTANSMKVRLEYYFQGVGQVSLGAYRRDFENFFGSTFLSATPEFLAIYGLDPDYGRYEVSTQYNLKDRVRMEGMDLSYRQALTFLPQWARGLQVFANGSLQKTKAPAGQIGALTFNEIPRTAAWGISLTRPKYNVRVNWTYRTDQNSGVRTGVGIEPDTYVYIKGYTKIDVLGEYLVWRRFSLFANLHNIGDVPNDIIHYGPNTPSVARLNSRERYGSLWTFGVKGAF